jgi:serpin B
MLRRLAILLFPFLLLGFLKFHTPSVKDYEAIVEANNEFALNLYKYYSQKFKNENIFFSPFSISCGFAMLYEGARGKTAEEIEKVFHFPKEEKARREGYLYFFKNFRGKKEYQLSIANGLWAQKDYPFVKDYFEIAKNFYLGKVENIDFKGNPEGARITINRWVERETKGKIRDLLPPRSIDKLTRLVIANSIYFEGIWENPFDSMQTKEEVFKIGARKNVKVPMMCILLPKKFNYSETSDLQILEMPYRWGDISCLVLLPKGNSLDKLEKSLNKENLKKWRKMLREESVSVYFPKFKMEKSYKLKNDLIKMGVVRVFDVSSDLAGITKAEKLFLTDAYHKSYIEMTEKGTVAGAGTAEPLVPGMGRLIFRADHPFVFIIQERKTGNIIFIGRLINPKS